MSRQEWRGGQDRRSFLKQLAVAGGAVLAGGCRAAAMQQGTGAAAVRADQIGVQLYSVRDQMEKDFTGTLERIAQIGFDKVEFAGLFGNDPQQVRALLDRLGLRAPSAHVGLEELQKDLPGQLRTARILGHEYVTVPALSEAFTGQPMDLAFWQRTAAEFNRLARSAREQGIGFAYHNHWFEFDPLPGGRTGWDVLVAETDPALVDFELDIFWAIFAGQDPLQMFQRAPGRYTMWHLKDVRDLQEARRLAANASNIGEFMQAVLPRLAAVGTGELDYRPIFARAEQAGLRHFFVENDAAPMTGASVENVATSYRNLREMLA